LEPIVLERVFSGQIAAVMLAPVKANFLYVGGAPKYIFRFRAPKINPRQNVKLISLRDV
jgi:hypothetical protein